MNDELEGRLYNFKFDQALQYLDGEDQHTRDLVEALAAMYGNPGDFYGHQSTAIVAALRSIGVTAFDDEDAPEPNALAKAVTAGFTVPVAWPVPPDRIDQVTRDGEVVALAAYFNTPAAAWVVPHEFGHHPIVWTYDSEGRDLMPSFDLDTDKVTLWLGEPTTGSVRVSRQ